MHDTESHTWRHLNFFEHEAYLTARVPRVICPEHGTRQVKVPWARERSDFTLLFEALAMTMAKEMPVKALAGLVGEHDTKLWGSSITMSMRPSSSRISRTWRSWGSTIRASARGRAT